MESAADDVQLLRAGVPRAGHLYYMQGRVEEAKRLMDRVRAELCDPALRPLADGIRAMFAAMSGDADTSLLLADEVLAQPAPPPQVRLAAHWARVVTLGALGRTDELGAADTHCHEIAATSYDSSLPRLGFGDLHVRVHRLTGQIRDATSLASTLVPEVRNTPTTIAPWVESIGAIASLARGEVRSAQSVAARCLDVMRGCETSGWLYTTAITLANASAMAGDGAAARAAAEEMERERHPGFRVMEPERMLAWAWVEAAEGSTTRAIQQARKTADVAARHGQWGYEAFALATAVRFGDQTVADRLAELATVVAGPRVRAAAVQAEALARSDGAALLEGSGMFEEMGDPLSAADAAAQAAVCFDNQDQRSAHQAACLRARQLQNQCEDASTPAVASALRPLPLTDREREIVALAAAGLSNRQIADRLVVSVRTVEGHLYRAGGKLGVTDRRQLTTVLRDDSEDLRPATRRTTGPTGR
jgi:ATP/maltotriose-dependent transcriptional regulator MalT